MDVSGALYILQCLCLSLSLSLTLSLSVCLSLSLYMYIYIYIYIYLYLSVFSSLPLLICFSIFFSVSFILYLAMCFFFLLLYPFLSFYLSLPVLLFDGCQSVCLSVLRSVWCLFICCCFCFFFVSQTCCVGSSVTFVPPIK